METFRLLFRPPARGIEFCITRRVQAPVRVSTAFCFLANRCANAAKLTVDRQRIRNVIVRVFAMSYDCRYAYVQNRNTLPCFQISFSNRDIGIADLRNHVRSDELRLLQHSAEPVCQFDELVLLRCNL